MRYTAVLTLFCIFFSLACFSQTEDDDYVSGNSTSTSSENVSKRKFDWSRFTVGTDLGLSLVFGDVTLIAISPAFGYYVTDNLVVGINTTYNYYSDKTLVVPYKTHIYGGGIYTQYLFDKLPVMLHTEGNWTYIQTDRIDVFGLLVGGGYKQKLAGNSYMYFLGLWNLNETSNSFNRNPVIRAGVAIGL